MEPPSNTSPGKLGGIDLNSIDPKMVGLQPGGWLEAAELLGLGGALLLLLTMGFAISLVIRGPAWLDSVKGIIDVVLTHRREMRRINKKVLNNHATMRQSINRRSRKTSAASKGKKP